MNTKASLFLLTAVICLSYSFHSYAVDNPILLDFSHSHYLDDVLKSGLKVKEDAAETSIRRTFTIAEGQNVLLRFPGGLELSQRNDEGGTMNVESNGILKYIYFYGQILPVEEVYPLSKQLHQALNIPLERLNDWGKNIQGKIGSQAQSYTNGTHGYYPNVDVEIRHSMSLYYPWKIGITLGWNIDDEAKNWDEKWGEAHNPRPPIGLEHISLNSPSGKTYSRKDEFRELNAKQEALDKKLGQVRDAEGRLVHPPMIPTPTVEKVEAPAATPSPSYWYIWLLLILVALIGVFWMMRKPLK